MEQQDYQNYANILQKHDTMQAERDIQHDLAGHETGRQKRLPADATGNIPEHDKRRRDSEQHLRNLSWLLANDPEYLKLYTETETLLLRAETITEDAIRQAELDLFEAKATLDKAATLNDGTLVLRKSDGTFCGQDGQAITDLDTLADIPWNGDEPSFEEYQMQKERAQRLETTLYDLRIYQLDVLAGAREQLIDEENPPSKQALDSIQDRINDNMPSGLNAQLKPIVTIETIRLEHTSNISIPTL